MWRVIGRPRTTCDGVARRDVLRVGALTLGGLTLADLFRLRAARAATGAQPELPVATAPRSAAARVIFIELAGGPSHFETYDPKPHAPAEYRGPLGTVATALPGVHFCESMPRQAALAERLAVIRSVHHDSSSHQTSSHLVQTGYYLRDRQNAENEMPCIGSVAARLRASDTAQVPPFVAIPRSMRYGNAGYLGKGFNPFETIGDPGKGKFEVRNLAPMKTLDEERLEDRHALLEQFDSLQRVRDSRGVSDAVDRFADQAFEIVTGAQAREAFDLARESDATRGAYGKTTAGQSLLLARRLVETGVAFVSIRIGGWDDHRQIAKSIRKRCPEYDQAVAALVADLHERGLERDVLVVAMGEFGRTPRVNKDAGRDHWGSVMSVLLAGGGLRMGQVIGASSARGETPANDPTRPEDVLATIYRHLGVDWRQQFVDFAGRPRSVLERGEPVAALL